MKDARKRDIILSKMSRKSVALASHIYFLKFLCKDGMLSSRHMMSLNYVKKTQDFTRLFAIRFLK